MSIVGHKVLEFVFSSMRVLLSEVGACKKWALTRGCACKKWALTRDRCLQEVGTY